MYIQRVSGEDSPDEIGQAIADWMGTLVNEMR
jgi:hypothetical protein